MRSWDWDAREGGKGEGREGKAEEGDKRGLKNGEPGGGAGWRCAAVAAAGAE